jgi:glycerophosphoryl diester phosphodiesterase
MTAIFAHRGLHTTARENTISAFHAARDCGVEGVELDVRRTSDGQLVVHHDPSAGDLDIAATSKASLPSYIPTLRESLDALVGLTVNVELKSLRQSLEPTGDDVMAFVHEVVSLVRDTGSAQSVIFSSFDLVTCEELKRCAPEIPVGWLLWLEDLRQAIPLAHERGFDAVNPSFRLTNRESVDLAQSLGLEVNVWTVNAQTDILAMAALGVDRIITDDPVLAISLVDSTPSATGR